MTDRNQPESLENLPGWCKTRSASSRFILRHCGLLEYALFLRTRAPCISSFCAGLPEIRFIHGLLQFPEDSHDPIPPTGRYPRQTITGKKGLATGLPLPTDYGGASRIPQAARAPEGRKEMEAVDGASSSAVLLHQRTRPTHSSSFRSWGSRFPRYTLPLTTYAGVASIPNRAPNKISRDR